MDIKKFVTPITRRSLFRDLSAGTVLLTISPLQRAFAETSSEYAKRFINFFVGNGMVPEAFYPDETKRVSSLSPEMFGTKDNQAGFSLNPILAHDLLDKTTIIRGINFTQVTKLFSGSAHNVGGLVTMSGGTYKNGKWTEPSIDQVIAANQPNQGYPIPSILLNTDKTRKNSKERATYSWKKSGSSVNPIDEVYGAKSFSALFDGFTFTGSSNNGSQIATPSNERILSLIDTNLEQIKKLKNRLGAQERQLLDSHLEHLVAIEKRYKPSANSTASPGSCSKPDKLSDDSHSDIVDGQMSHLLSALQCGRLNVATMILQGSGSDLLYSREIDMSDKIEHHGISHKNSSSGFAAHARINRWAVEKVARFAKELDSIQEDGGTMLDNSIVCISYELGKGRGHDHYDVAQVIFGKAGQQYKGGQFLNYGASEKSGVAVNDVLLSHCRAMGIDSGKVSKVGTKSVASGNIVTELFT